MSGTHRTRPAARLGDGVIGYYSERIDDCLRPAIATATQIPIEQVPHLRLLDRLTAGEDPEAISIDSWLRIAGWLNRRGLELVFHDIVPVDRERWIGVCPDAPGEYDAGHLTRQMRRRLPRAARQYADVRNPFADHCLVMSHNRVIHDPAKGLPVPSGMKLRTWSAADVTYGISFDPINPKE